MITGAAAAAPVPLLLRQKNLLTKAPFAAIIFEIPINASVAQSVVHLTRNEKVACSSQVTSSKDKTPTFRLVSFVL